jgi:signal peptidase II
MGGVGFVKKVLGIKNRRFWIAASLGLILDRVTKLWILHTFTLQQSVSVIPGVLNWTYVVNTGAAFSLFSGAIWLRWLSLIVSLGLAIWAIWGPKFTRWEQVGYGLILSGAFGNGIDRFVFGHVIDFIDIKLINFAIFNVADMFINVGIVCLLIATFKRSD